MQIEVTPKRGLIAAGISTLVVVALLATGYVIGRYHTPPTVVTQEKVRVQEVEKQVIVTQTKVETEVKVVKVTDRDNNIHRTYLIEEKPDGTKVTHIIEDDKSEINVNLNAQKGETVTNNTHTDTFKETVRTEEKTVTKTTAKPQWKAGALIGYHLPGVWGDHVPNLLPLHQDLVVGASVERRLAGPFFVGLWGTSTKDVGASLHVEW